MIMKSRLLAPDQLTKGGEVLGQALFQTHCYTLPKKMRNHQSSLCSTLQEIRLQGLTQVLCSNIQDILGISFQT